MRFLRILGRLVAVLGVVILAVVAADIAAPSVRGDSTSHQPAGRLDPAFAARLDDALVAAHAQGISLEVTSGWRSAAQQQHLLGRAIRRYGSRKAATRWVLPPRDSAHVRGLAVDVGPPAGARWLRAHGSVFGLCQAYRNEPWHFEPLTTREGRCPAPKRHPVAS